MTLRLIFLLRIMYFPQIILDSDQETLASINLFQLIAESLVFLLWGSKFVGYSLISPKLLAKYGIMDRYLSCVKWCKMVFFAKRLIF